MPLVAGEGAAAPTRQIHRHGCGHTWACLEELDLTVHVAGKRHVYAHARLPNVGASPTFFVCLVDHDGAAHDPLATSAARGRIVHRRGLGVAVGGHVGAAAHAQQAVLAREVAHLAVGRVGARGGLERGVVVAASHRWAAAHVVHSSIPKGWELVNCQEHWARFVSLRALGRV